MFAGMFYQGCAGSNNQSRGEAKGVAAARVGDVVLTVADLEGAIRQSEQQRQQSGVLEPEDEVSIYTTALSQRVVNAQNIVLINKAKIPVDDKAILGAVELTMQQEKMMLKFKLAQQGQLSMTATDAELDAALKKQGAKTFAELVAQNKKLVSSKLGDSAIRERLVADLAEPIARQYYANQVRATDDDVKSSYDGWTLKRVYLGPVDDVGTKALADLKNGSTFEAVMDRYSKDPVQGGKKVSEGTITFAKSQLLSEKEFEPLRNLKAGDTTGVIKVRDGYAIYKLVEVKPNPPKDFDANKATYVDQYRTSQSTPAYNAAFEEAKKEPIKWELKGYKAVYEFGELRFHPVSDKVAEKKQLDAMMADAKAAVDAKGPDLRAAQVGYYAIAQAIYDKADDKAAARPALITALEGYLDGAESVKARLRLADLYIEAKDGVHATNQVIQAFKANGTYDAEGARTFRDISEKALALKTKGLLSPDGDKQILDEQQKWRQLKDREDKAEAEVKKAADEAKKKADEEDKKLAEAKKAAEAKKPAPTKPDAPKTDPTKTDPAKSDPAKPDKK